MTQFRQKTPVGIKAAVQPRFVAQVMDFRAFLSKLDTYTQRAVNYDINIDSKKDSVLSESFSLCVNLADRAN